MLNITQIPAARVALTEPENGLITTQWYRYMVNLNTLVGNGTGIVPVISGGTGQSSYTNGQLLIGNSNGNTLTKSTLTAGNNINITNGNGSITIDATLPTNLVNTFSAGTTGFIPATAVSGDVVLSGTLNPSNGGTGATSLTGYVIGNGTMPMTASSTIPSSNVTYTAPFTSSVLRTATSKWSDIVSVKDFGAVGDGIVNDTAAIQAAVNTGKHVYIPAGTYYITNGINISTPGQMISGDGRNQSKLKVTSAFNLSANGVLWFSGGEPGPELSSIAINFTQPDTASRASLTLYPPAIYAVDCPRFTVSDVKITNAMYGIDMRGNSGGAFIDLLEMSAYSTGIQIDGSLDTIRVNRFHFWTFDLTANQTSIFYAAPTRAFSIGRVDGLFIHQFLNISNLGVYMFQGATGQPWVYITDSGFDSWNGIQKDAGTLQVVNSYITNTNGGGWWCIQENSNAGWSQFTNCLFFLGPANGVSPIKVSGTSSQVSFTNCHVSNYMSAQAVFYVNGDYNFVTVSDTTFDLGAANGFFAWAVGNYNKLHLVNNYINAAPNTAFTQPMIQTSNTNRSYITGNRINDKGTNAATFILVSNDDYNWVSGNIAPGWTNSFPAPTTGYYANNLV